MLFLDTLDGIAAKTVPILTCRFDHTANHAIRRMKIRMNQHRLVVIIVGCR
jgi:hypothetical protein